jgi:hypothetical protein
MRQAETAKALGLNVPDKLLVGTNEVSNEGSLCCDASVRKWH